MKKINSLNNYTELSPAQLNQTVGGDRWKNWNKWDFNPKRNTISSTPKIA